MRRRYPRVANALRAAWRPDRVRPLRLIALTYVAIGLLAAIVFRSTIAAQGDALVVLSAVLETPVLTWVVERTTDEPHLAEVSVAGVPATVVRPGGSGPWPVVVFVNGVTPRGRHHPDVQALARGLARAGYLVVVPDPPGLADGEITLRTLGATVAVAREATTLPDARDARVGFLGVSVGGSLALVAAAEPVLAGRVTVVAAIAPYADLVDVFRLATIGSYVDRGRLVRYRPPSYLTLIAARSLVAALPGTERDELLAVLPATDEVDENPPDPVAGLRALPRDDLSPEARAVLALLRNREPTRFDELYGALPSTLRAANARLSPLTTVARVRARVELASAPEDKYFPLAESRELARLARNARVTVTTTLEHAVPEPSLGGLADLARFDAFAVRVLERAG